MNLKLGIIINTFNNEKSVSKAINSAISLKKNKFIKIVVVDDCSRDNTFEILKKFKKSKKIDLIYKNKKNLGISRSRNIGIRLCKDTDYITFLDGDDYINPKFSKYFSKIKNTLRSNIVLFNFNYCFNNNIIKNKFFNENKILKNLELKNYFLRYLEKPNKYSLFTTCWSKLYNTKIIKKNNLKFNEKLKLCEDTDFVFRYLANINVKDIVFLNFSMYFHTLKKGKGNYKKLTFGTNINLKNQISFLEALKSCQKYLLKLGVERALIKQQVYHCKVAYICIYLVRSSLKINSLITFFENYNFWKKFLKRKLILKSINNYSVYNANGNKILYFFLKQKFYFFLILFAYFTARNRYL